MVGVGGVMSEKQRGFLGSFQVAARSVQEQPIILLQGARCSFAPWPCGGGVVGGGGIGG